MELSILLAKIIGVTALVKAVALLTRKKELQDIAEDLLKTRSVLMLIAGFELVFGLILVNIHNIWVNEWYVIITILGWVMVIEAIYIYLTPIKKVQNLYRVFLTKKWINLCIVLLLAIGLYLTKIGFGY